MYITFCIVLLYPLSKLFFFPQQYCLPGEVAVAGVAAAEIVVDAGVEELRLGELDLGEDRELGEELGIGQGLDFEEEL